MARFESQNSMLRYTVIACLFVGLSLLVLGKSVYIMTVERTYWMAVDSLEIKDSIEVKPVRGNILGCDKQRLACNLPEYKMHVDFVALIESKNDTLLFDKDGKETKMFDELCKGLHEIFPDSTEESFKVRLKRGYVKKSRYCQVVKHRVDYTTYQQCRKLPVFCLRSNIGGFSAEEFMARNRPYGELAASLVGGVYKEAHNGAAYSGLELAYDSILKGQPGYVHRKKVLNRFVNFPDSIAINGCDIVTSIDVRMQDLAERSLKNELKEVGAYTGVAIVMEVKTGDIKAMVNLDLNRETGEYHEGRNHAIADLLEPGSVFKTASFMVALEDGKIDTTMSVDTGNGIMEMHGSTMRDHNWHKGGYGRLTVPQILMQSSNIGVSYLIDKAYGKHPQKFVQGLYNVGIAEDLKLPFPEYSKPRIRMPKKGKDGAWSNWYNSALPWMSIGYETQVPPISVVTFYNAIANNGKMLRPRLVKSIEKDGEVIETFEPVVLKEKICSDNTLNQMQTLLRKVATKHATGKFAMSRYFPVAGKTGTAQKASNGQYAVNGVKDYLLSFCGYFPADNPEYTCIVCIHKHGPNASGGRMCGKVFHEISEGIMAQRLKYPVKDSRDKSSEIVPEVKDGNILAADYVLSRLGIRAEGGWEGSHPTGTQVWGKVERRQNAAVVKKSSTGNKSQMPNVIGMGARDAVFLIESRGGKVTLSGRGRVRRQSKSAGTTMRRGEKVELELA